MFKGPKTPRLDALLAGAGRTIQNTQSDEIRRTALDAERRRRIEDMLQRAGGEGWSQRELARRAGLSWGGWRRILAGQANLQVWLPRLRAAVSRLNSTASAPLPT